MDLIDKIMKFERELPEEDRITRENIESRLKIFPEGVFYLTDDSGNIIAFSSSMVLMSQEVYQSDSWDEVTDNGNITEHKPYGNALYIVDVVVHPEWRKKGLGNKIVQLQLDLAHKLNLKFIILASRVPGFHKHRGNIYNYLSRIQDSDYLIHFFQELGFHIDGIRPNYRKNDEESNGYGVLMYQNVNGKLKGAETRKKFKS